MFCTKGSCSELLDSRDGKVALTSFIFELRLLGQFCVLHSSNNQNRRKNNIILKRIWYRIRQCISHVLQLMNLKIDRVYMFRKLSTFWSQQFFGNVYYSAATYKSVMRNI
jgi:hypothetical protein